MMRTKVSDIQVNDNVIEYHKERSTPSMAMSDEHIEKDEKVDLNQFEMLWAVADYVDWENNYKSIGMFESTLLNSLSKEQAEQLRVEFNTVKNTLDDVLFASSNNKVEEFYGGPDSYGDLLDHIVSLGKDFVADIAANKETAWQHLRDNPPKEAFSYILPSKSDYENKPKTFEQKAQEELDDIETKIQILEQDNHLKDDYKKEVIESARALTTPLQHVIDGNETAIENIDTKTFGESIKHYNEMAEIAHSVIGITQRQQNDEEPLNSRIIDNAVISIPKNYVEEKKALREVENVDFSHYDQSYRNQFNQVDEPVKNKSSVRPR